MNGLTGTCRDVFMLSRTVQRSDDWSWTWRIQAHPGIVVGAFKSLASNLMLDMHHHEARSKVDQHWWAPVMLTAPALCEENVACVNLLVLDCDGIGSHENAMTFLRGVQSAFICHSTWSDSARIRKWRLIIPLENPVPRGNWSKYYHMARTVIGTITDAFFDAATSNPARHWFCPSQGRGRLAPTPFLEWEHGQLLDLGKLHDEALARGLLINECRDNKGSESSAPPAAGEAENDCPF